MNRYKIAWIILISAVTVVSCKVSEPATSASDINKVAVEKPRILFINYSISENKTDQEYSIHLINKIISSGKIKENSMLPYSPRVDDLEYIVSDNNQKVLLRNFIANPLNKTVEFVDDYGQLAKKDIRLDSSLFSLRIQLDPAARYISLERYIGTGNGNIHLHVVDITKEAKE